MPGWRAFRLKSTFTILIMYHLTSSCIRCASVFRCFGGFKCFECVFLYACDPNFLFERLCSLLIWVLFCVVVAIISISFRVAFSCVWYVFNVKFKYFIHSIQHWILIGRFDTRFHCACAMRFLILSAIYNFTITTRSRVLCSMFNAFTTVCLQQFCRIIIILISNHYFDLYESTNAPSLSFSFCLQNLSLIRWGWRLKSHTNFYTFQADARYSPLTT